MPQKSTRTAGLGGLAGAPTTGNRPTRSRRLRGLRRRAPGPGRTLGVLGESFRSWAFCSFGFAGQVAHDVEAGPQRQAVPQLPLSLLDGRAMELSLADVLDGFKSRTGRGQRARVQFWVRELPGERNVHALNIDESVRREESLACTRPAE